MEVNPNFSDKALYDYNLVQKALKNNDQRAYAELLERYRDIVYIMLLKIINNKDDAEDLTIEAFAKAFQQLDKYNSQFAFSTWLFRLASNICLDQLRKTKLSTKISIDNPVNTDDENSDMFLQFSTDALNPEQKTIKHQKIELVHLLVNKLKPNYRELVELFYLKELSYEEIAEKTYLPVGTVKNRLFKAKELLNVILRHSKGKL